VNTVQRSLALLASDLQQSGVGSFTYDPETVEFEMVRYGAYGGHHIGTARMHAQPQSGVVDANCRVHGVANLFIASSAVFPTSSQANPTFTIVAIAARLAAHLRVAQRSAA
jgi:choline dehydrogenase-like flavoprotein